MKKAFILIFSALILAFSIQAEAVDKYDGKNSLQRRARGFWDLQQNTVSNFELHTTNYGIIGIYAQYGTGGGIWPRGSQNKYLFGAGFWFGAVKRNPENTDWRKYVEISYNPNNGRSWFVPGSIEDGNDIDSSVADKYRIYISTDFDKTIGQPLNTNDGPNWPFWINDKNYRYEYGTYSHTYVHDIEQRNLQSYPFGPLFVSDEDIVSIFKDTDLNYFDGGVGIRKPLGYPLGLQVESKIFTWGTDEMKDVVVISYNIKNCSADTLRDCWFAGIYDTDIAYAPNEWAGAANDHSRFYNGDESLNLAVSWSDTNRGEAGRGFGYIGISYLESPAVDANGFIRHDKTIFIPDEQIGLKTFHNWSIEEDVPEDEERYNIISSKIRDLDNGPGDKRMLLGTGPFNVLPGDVARVVLCMTFAMPAKGGEADGTDEDLAGFTQSHGKPQGNRPLADEGSLIKKLLDARDAYYYPLILGVNDGESDANGANAIRCYPNPAMDFVDIEFNVVKSGFIKISISDNLGKEIAVPFEEVIEAGPHSLRLPLEKIPGITSGVYYLSFKTAYATTTKPICIIK